MQILKKLSALPENFPNYLGEMLPEYTVLYGECAAQHYAATLEASLSTTLAHPGVTAYGMVSKGDVIGMMIALMRYGVGEIVFVHVLQAHREQGLEADLLRGCVEALEQQGATRLVSETMPLYAVNLDAAFIAHDFQPIKRALMRRALSHEDSLLAQGLTTPMSVEDEPAAALVLLDAYADHPDRVLHHELQQHDASLSLLRRFRAGEFGAVPPEWMRVTRHQGGCSGLIMGHAISDDTGYAFQLAVAPALQGQGIGRCLLQALVAKMAATGMQRMLLGVTLSNPAIVLYRDLGFSLVRTVAVYVRDEAPKK